jgi:hypothetical protein
MKNKNTKKMKVLEKIVGLLLTLSKKDLKTFNKTCKRNNK